MNDDRIIFFCLEELLRREIHHPGNEDDWVRMITDVTNIVTVNPLPRNI
jgi:hypothetical protein